MFRKKESQEPPKNLNGRYIKVDPSQRGGFIEYGRVYNHNNNSTIAPRGISEVDISESYFSERDEQELNQRRIDSEKSNKSSRRIIPFLQKKKKGPSQSAAQLQRGPNVDVMGYNDNDENDNDDGISDITTYAEGMPVVYEGHKKTNTATTTASQPPPRLDLDHYAEEAQIYERMNYIIENYRPPPPYPGDSKFDNGGKSMIQQLLQEKANVQMRDTASMINYCQVDAPKGLSMEDLTKIMHTFAEEASETRPINSPYVDKAIESNNTALSQNLNATSVRSRITKPPPVNIHKDDKLVMRTLRSPRSPEPDRSNPVTPDELFEFRKQLYQEAALRSPQAICELYPRDYDADYDHDSTSENVPESTRSVPENVPNSTSKVPDEPTECIVADGGSPRQNYIVDVMPSNSANEFMRARPPDASAQPPVYREHPARDYDVPASSQYNIDLDDLRVQPPNTTIDHRYEKSETYVPPSPYMYAEIPEWLQVYAKASPDLDQYLKWEMFRLPELDCWQTMLKRLYMKELEQIVLWFEEYRQSMHKEIDKRERDLGIRRMPIIDPRMKKTDV
eukprot:Seg1455.6 transcript_id=Seg1455.6/GoldUCD/mRNA.D3Y31 product="Protein salvador 1" protein_id=Seg1455.6/GoldUCD/D3Y31